MFGFLILTLLDSFLCWKKCFKVSLSFLLIILVMKWNTTPSVLVLFNEDGNFFLPEIQCKHSKSLCEIIPSVDFLNFLHLAIISIDRHILYGFYYFSGKTDFPASASIIWYLDFFNSVLQKLFFLFTTDSSSICFLLLLIL